MYRIFIDLGLLALAGLIAYLEFKPSLEVNNITGDTLLYYNDEKAPGGRAYITLVFKKKY